MESNSLKDVVIGSTNRIKIGACRKVLEPFGYQVIGKEVDSMVSDQPKTDEETIQGAVQRAFNLQEGYLRIGLEAGVTYQSGVLYLVNWGALVDENENVFLAGGTRIPLPKVIEQLIMQDGLELSDAMEEYFHQINIKHNEGAIGYFTSNLVVREEIFIHIVKLLYGQYLYFKKEGSNKICEE